VLYGALVSCWRLNAHFWFLYMFCRPWRQPFLCAASIVQ
jgi:hypothetical protein